MLTGLLFVTTAFSYAEATTIFPEAGGSSSFARHTFNEFVSFGAGWALMLDYIITIAISAFFVPNYLAAFWPILKTWPVRLDRRHRGHRLPRRDQHRRHQRGGAAQHHPRHRRPQHAGAARPRRPVRLSVAPAADHPDPLRHGADLAPVHLRHLDRHGRLYRHRDDLQHGRRVGQPGPRRAAGGQVRPARGARRLLSDLAWSACRPCRCTYNVAAGQPGHGCARRRSSPCPPRRANPVVPSIRRPTPASRSTCRVTQSGTTYYIPASSRPARSTRATGSR